MHGRVVWGLVCPLILWWAGDARAGAWQQPTGTGLVIQTQEYLRAKSAERLFEQQVLRNYAEVPLGAYTLGYKTGYAFQQAEGPGYLNTASGFNEAELFVSRHRTFGSYAFAVRGTGILPTTKTARGQRQMGQDAGAELGVSLGRSTGPFFADAYTGYRTSFGGDAEQWRADATFGVKRGGALLLAQTFVTKGLGGSEPGGLDFDLTQASLSAVLPVRGGLSLELGGRADLAARGFDEGQSLFFAFWWRR